MTERANNSARMKRTNKYLLLRMLREAPRSRAELARASGLTRAAVSLITEPLLKGGLIKEGDPGVSAQGRRPIMLELVPAARYALGVNLARGHCAAGICDLSGRVVTECMIDLGEVKTAEGAMEIIGCALDDMIKKERIPKKKLTGLGITAPGPLLAKEGKILAPPNFTLWENTDVTAFFRGKFAFPVMLENNSHALTRAERAYGKGRETENFILLNVDTGVGAGIVMNGVLFSGCGGFGSEIGHTSVDPNGRACACGNVGCLETYAAVPNLLRDTPYKDWKSVADAADGGNTEAAEIVALEAEYLAKALVSAVNLFAPETVVIAGDLTYEPEELLTLLEEKVNARSITGRYQRVKFAASRIHDNTGVMTAANLALDNFFEA